MATLRKIKAASPESEGSSSKQLPSTELTLGIMASSSFQSASTDGERHAKRIAINPLQEHHHNNIIVEDLTLDDPSDEEMKPTIEGSGSPSTHDGQAIRLASSARPPQQEADRKRLNRMMSNRLSAKRSRARRNEYVAEMERQAKYLENKIAILQPQIVAYEHQRHLLLIEHHQVKYRMALLEKERLLKEVEAERMKDEILRLLELQRQQEQTRSEVMRSWGADMKLMCSPNPDTSVSEPVEPVVDSSSSVDG
ncbi:basic leucine zipper 34-like [Prosopis cineraria]|uniref:basic leucine zipper 34-like n=1 Tax=Prosopis cineraria TaxID=364024 RepID=UPI00241038B1|nr:basic leucine zipper 34-like [Prosopis cineraria]